MPIVGGFDGDRDQPVADEIAERFGPVRVALIPDQAVKPLQEIGVECDSDSAQAGHLVQA